mgnify:CR=1 FL=1
MFFIVLFNIITIIYLHVVNIIIMDIELIKSRIFEIRSQPVMIDFDLANLYQVQAVSSIIARNIGPLRASHWHVCYA